MDGCNVGGYRIYEVYPCLGLGWLISKVKNHRKQMCSEGQAPGDGLIERYKARLVAKGYA